MNFVLTLDSKYWQGLFLLPKIWFKCIFGPKIFGDLNFKNFDKNVWNLDFIWFPSTRSVRFQIPGRILAWAVGVPVSRRSGSQLAKTLVDTKNILVIIEELYSNSSLSKLNNFEKALLYKKFALTLREGLKKIIIFAKFFVNGGWEGVLMNLKSTQSKCGWSSKILRSKMFIRLSPVHQVVTKKTLLIQLGFYKISIKLRLWYTLIREHFGGRNERQIAIF